MPARALWLAAAAALVAAVAGMPAGGAPAEISPGQSAEYMDTVNHMVAIFRRFGISMQHHLMLRWYLEKEARRNGQLDEHRHHLDASVYYRANRRVWNGVGRMTAKDIAFMAPETAKMAGDAQGLRALDKAFEENRKKAYKLKMSISRCSSCRSWEACYGACKAELEKLAADLDPNPDKVPALLSASLGDTRKELSNCLAQLKACNADEELGEGGGISKRRGNRYTLNPRLFGRKGADLTAKDEEALITGTPRITEIIQKREAKELHVKRTAMMEEEDRKKSAVLHRTLSYPSGLMADLSELEKEAQAADQQEKAQGLAEVRAQNAKAIRAQGAYMLQKALLPKKMREAQEAETAEDPMKDLGVAHRQLMQCYLDTNENCGRGASFHMPAAGRL